MRRDLQQTFIALTDATILIAGRAVEVSGWTRKSGIDLSNGGDTDSLTEKLALEAEEEVTRLRVVSSEAHDVRILVVSFRFIFNSQLLSRSLNSSLVESYQIFEDFLSMLIRL